MMVRCRSCDWPRPMRSGSLSYLGTARHALLLIITSPGLSGGFGSG